MGFQHSSYEGEEDELSLETLKAAKSSSWQGEIHSWALLLFSEIPIQSPGGLFSVNQQFQKHCTTTARTKIWRLWGSSDPGGIGEFTLESSERDIPKGKVFWGCLRSEIRAFWSVSAGSRQITTANSPNLAFFLLWCKQESLGWFWGGAGTAGQTLRGTEKCENAEEELQRRLVLAAPVSPLGVWQCSKLG